ncbi:hypothetical protein [Bradyrhizobium sp. USDA 3364]
MASEAPLKPVADPFIGKNIRGVARLAEGLDPISDEDVNWGIYKRAGDKKGEHVTPLRRRTCRQFGQIAQLIRFHLDGISA